MVAGGRMMESDRQLNHALKMPPQRLVARHGAPDVLKNFMSVKKMGAVEEIESLVEVLIVIVMVGRHGHLGLGCVKSFRLVYMFP
jgi:hypothetical protein